jgi:hypothetical protein
MIPAKSRCSGRVILQLLIASSLFFLSSGSSTASAKAFSNCSSLRSSSLELSSGIALNTSSAGITNAVVNVALYNENRRLDTDNDGVVCERDVYNLGINRNTPGVNLVKSACFSEVASRQNVLVLIGTFRSYYTLSDQIFIQIPQIEQASKLMQSAASSNAVFQAAAKSAQQELDFLKQAWRYSLTGKEYFGRLPDDSFNEMCGLIGVYEGRTGIFPPIPLKTYRFPETPLNGARWFCQRVFELAPPLQNVYSKSESLSLNECDKTARTVALRQSTYQGALNEMVKIFFTFRDYWCWGKSCISKFDF